MSNTKSTVAAMVLAAMCGQVCAQTALGDGRGLERDLSGRGIGNAPRRDFMAEVRARNDLVTGNAVGGRSFRGDVGYRSGDEFRGSLGSDDLFSFRRDSLGGGAAGTGYRGTNALQYQYSYSTANQFEGSTLSRTGGATGTAKYQPLPVRNTTPRRVSTDTFSGLGEGWNSVAPKMGVMRSTSAFSSTHGLSAAVIGERDGPEGRESLTASSLLGLRTTKSRRSDTPRDALNQRVGERIERGADTKNTAGFGESTKPGDADKDQVRTSYSEVVSRLGLSAGDATAASDAGIGAGRKPAEVDKPRDGAKDAAVPEGAAADAGMPLWESRLAKLREKMEEVRALRVRGLDEQVALQRHADKTKKKPEAGTAPVAATGNEFIDYDSATLEMIRLGGGEISKFTLSTVERDLYSKYMTDGAAALGRGRYFDAEEQFARCLSISPGDPMASAARINSQLGGALFLSAAINLVALYESHPELTGVRYTGETIPSPKRLADVAIVLRERIAKARKETGTIPEDAGFLMAYIGFQIKDAALISEGFATLDEAGAATGPHADILALVKGVWKLN